MIGKFAVDIHQVTHHRAVVIVADDEENLVHVHIQEEIDLEVIIGATEDHVADLKVLTVKMVNVIQQILRMKKEKRKIFNGSVKRRREREMIMKVLEMLTNQRHSYYFL